MVRNRLHSQRIKIIKTITGNSLDFFLIYKCLQLARKKILPSPPLSFTPFCLCATISDCFNIFPFCLPETIFNCTDRYKSSLPEVWLFPCFDTSSDSWYPANKVRANHSSSMVLRCFDTVFRRPYRCFWIDLKVIYPCLIATRFSPVIDYELKFVKIQFLVKSISRWQQ